MGEWEKIRYRNVKKNYEALVTLGNRKCWVPGSLGSVNHVFGLSVSLALSEVASSAHSCLPCGDQPAGNVCPSVFSVGLALAAQSSPLPDSPSPSYQVTLTLWHFPSPLGFVPPSSSSLWNQDFAPFQVSEPLGQLSCVTAGRPSKPRWVTLRILMKNGLQGSKVRGQEDLEVSS